MYIAHIDAGEYFYITFAMKCLSVFTQYHFKMQLTDLYQSIDFRRTFKIVEWHILIIKKAKTVAIVEALLSITYYVDYLSFLMLLKLFLQNVKGTS